MYNLGIDLGGTNIKAGVVGEGYALLSSVSVRTEARQGGEAVAENIIQAANSAIEQAGVKLAEISSIGLCSPGLVDPSKATIEFSGNLRWSRFPLGEKMESAFPGLPVTLANDANSAALGEYLAGSAKGASSAVVITLGTGVGAGIILDGRILSGYGGGAGELGHMVVVKDGKPCSCGRRGCWEAYCSATGLGRMTQEAMDLYPDSVMLEISRERGKISARTPFIAARQGDAAGVRVVDEYISFLACGIANIINMLQPEVICIGGGVGQEGENLLRPLREQVRRQVLGGEEFFVTSLRGCTLGNSAGIIGAAMLRKSPGQLS